VSPVSDYDECGTEFVIGILHLEVGFSRIIEMIENLINN